MPVGRRYELLDWAAQNNSIIIEDDYDSELRYFGKPVPALQGLDNRSCVVYLGTFSSTLFPAVKISYMVLPEKMAQIFRSIKHEYTQTCSKAEQLTLAFFMEDGHYYTGIRKLRSLYSQKLQAALVGIFRTRRRRRFSDRYPLRHQPHGKSPFKKKSRAALRRGKVTRSSNGSPVRNNRPGNQCFDFLLQPPAAGKD